MVVGQGSANDHARMGPDEPALHPARDAEQRSGADLTLGLEHMRTLQLEPAQVRTAADFFETYASHALSSGRADEEEGHASSSIYLLDAASSLRAAGQWAMLFDAQRAARLLTAAAQIWQTLGYGFGTFVLAAVAPRQLDRRNTNDQLRQLAQQYTQGRAVQSIRTQQLPEPMLHPQQQAYLLLACASLWRRFDLEPGLLRIIIDQSPHRRGVAPIGALGTPLRQY